MVDFCFEALLCQNYELLFARSSFNTVAVISCWLISVWFAVRTGVQLGGVRFLFGSAAIRVLGHSVCRLWQEDFSNVFGGRRFFLLKEWRLRTVGEDLVVTFVSREVHGNTFSDCYARSMNLVYVGFIFGVRTFGGRNVFVSHVHHVHKFFVV